jgi:hypothetical protein
MCVHALPEICRVHAHGLHASESLTLCQPGLPTSEPGQPICKLGHADPREPEKRSKGVFDINCHF